MGYVHHLAEPILPISTLPRMLFMDVLKYRIEKKKERYRGLKISPTPVSVSQLPSSGWRYEDIQIINNLCIHVSYCSCYLLHGMTMRRDATLYTRVPAR